MNYIEDRGHELELRKLQERMHQRYRVIRVIQELDTETRKLLQIIRIDYTLEGVVVVVR